MMLAIDRTAITAAAAISAHYFVLTSLFILCVTRKANIARSILVIAVMSSIFARSMCGSVERVVQHRGHICFITRLESVRSAFP